MILDEHTPCPACAQIVRDAYAAARRVLEQDRTHVTTDHVELHLRLEALRVYVEAHHANQLHSHSLELEDARHPGPPQASASVSPVLPFDRGDRQR